jgi:hypothetical protein
MHVVRVRGVAGDGGDAADLVGVPGDGGHVVAVGDQGGGDGASGSTGRSDDERLRASMSLVGLVGSSVMSVLRFVSSRGGT